MTLNNRSVRILFALLKLTVTALALWLVLRHFGVEWLLSVLSKVDPLWLALAEALTLVQLAQMAKRWQLTSEIVLASRPGFWKLLLALGRSQFYGLPLPSVVGADAIRIAALARDSGLSNAARSVVADRLLGLFSMVLVVTVSLPLFALRISYGPAFGTLAIASVGGLTAFAILMLAPRLFRRIPIVGLMLAAAGSDLYRLIGVRGRAGSVFLQAFVTHLFSASVFWSLARSVGTSLVPIDALLIVLPATLVASIPISLNGWGVREATVASAFSFIGADIAQGAVTSILFGLTQPLAGLIIECVSVPLRK